MAVDVKMPAEKQALIKFALSVACELSGSDSGSIMIVEGDNIVIKGYNTSDPAIDPAGKIGIAIKIGERVAGKCAQSGEPIIIVGDVNKDSRFSGIQKFREIKSGASVPVMKEGKIKGVINVSRTESAAPITKDDVDVVAVVGKYLAEYL